jgi:hypothetical protein
MAGLAQAENVAAILCMRAGGMLDVEGVEQRPPAPRVFMRALDAAASVSGLQNRFVSNRPERSMNAIGPRGGLQRVRRPSCLRVCTTLEMRMLDVTHAMRSLFLAGIVSFGVPIAGCTIEDDEPDVHLDADELDDDDAEIDIETDD